MPLSLANIDESIGNINVKKSAREQILYGDWVIIF